MFLLTLDGEGVVVAVAVAALLMVFGGSLGPVMIGFMLYFLVLAFIVTYIRIDYKERRGLTERRRGVANVLSNGLGPVVFAVLFYLGNTYAIPALATLGLFGFLGSVAAITSDKFSSELGVLDGLPHRIFSRKVAKKGESGAVTPLGFSAGALGAFLVAVPAIAMAVMGGTPLAADALFVALSVTLSGFVGTMADSVAGVFEQKGKGNKHTSNLICSFAGGLFEIALVAAFLL